MGNADRSRNRGMPPLEFAAWHALLFVVFFLVARASMDITRLPPTNVGAIWLPAGVALAALHSRLGWSAAPTIFLATWAVIASKNGYAFFSWRPYSFLICGINVLQAALANAVWRKGIRTAPFEDAQAYLKFVAGVAFLPTLLTSWAVIATIHAAGFLRGMTWGEFWMRASVTTLGDALGIILVAPLVFAPLRDGIARTVRQAFLAQAGNLLVSAVFCGIAFEVFPPAIYLSIPLALASGVICGTRGVAVFVLFVAVAGHLATAAGHGPFGTLSSQAPFEPVLKMALMAFGLGLPGQFAGIAMRQLRQNRRNLEQQVEERTRELREVESRYRIAVDAVSDGIFDWEPADGVVRGNAHFHTMLGRPADSGPLDYRALRRLMHPEDRKTLRAAIARSIVPGGGDVALEARIHQPDGGWRWIRSRGSCVVRDTQGTPLRIVGTTTDVTDEKDHEIALEAARLRAESADRAKSEFLAAMSHEIRTPMHGVLGFARLLRSSELADQQREFADSIVVSGEILLALLNDILDLSKIEAGAFSLDLAPTRIREVAANTVRLFDATASGKNLRLDVTVSPDLPAWLETDATRLSQILANLASNAVKFTEKGGISIRISGSPANTDSSRWRILLEVEDTGIGISESQMAQLFRPFGQADTSITRRYGGTGLGLVISRRLCELMGGTLTATSTAGKGSLFMARIDAIQADAPENSRDTEDDEFLPAKKPTGGLHVLVVEDNAMNRKLAKFLLDRLGHRTSFALNGREAVECVDKTDYDLVLMDVQMPEMDGLSAARRIRERESANNKHPVPIVAVTAAATAEDRKECLEAGMTGYLVKPIDLHQLRQLLAGIANQPSSARAS